MAFIFHIISKSQWHTNKSGKEYAPKSLEDEGFIHFSYADQLISVANSFYSGQKDLILLK